MAGKRKFQADELQQAIYRVVIEYQNDRGYPPTIREIGERVKIDSTSHIKYHLDQLVAKGMIDRAPGRSRSIRGPHQIPIYGRIQAGLPIDIPDSYLSHFDPYSYLDYDELLPRGEQGVFALEVQGDSMIDAGVFDKDIVVLKHVQSAQNGEMVAAYLRSTHSVTLKYFFYNADEKRVRLQPANPAFDPIFADPDDVEIQGLVVSILKMPNRRRL